MPIVSGDIEFHLSAAGTSPPDEGLGGPISATEIVDATVENLFDNVSVDEATTGHTDYRCFYVKNANAQSPTINWVNVKVWVGTETPSPSTQIDVGLDPAGIGDGVNTGVATTIADEVTAPGGVTFSHPTSRLTSIAIGDIPGGEAQAIWLRRTVSSGAAAIEPDSVIIRIEGDTPE